VFALLLEWFNFPTVPMQAEVRSVCVPRAYAWLSAVWCGANIHDTRAMRTGAGLAAEHL